MIRRDHLAQTRLKHQATNEARGEADATRDKYHMLQRPESAQLRAIPGVFHHEVVDDKHAARVQRLETPFVQGSQAITGHAAALQNKTIILSMKTIIFSMKTIILSMKTIIFGMKTIIFSMKTIIFSMKTIIFGMKTIIFSVNLRTK